MNVLKNYHTHTVRCKHATGTVADYIEAGIKLGMTEIGISDHTPLPNERWLSARMPMKDLGDYIEEIDLAIEKYPQIKILKAAECEYAPEYEAFYNEVLLQEHSFDYLVGGVHYVPYHGSWLGCGELTPRHLGAFAKYTIESMESGLFSFMAHPDVFGYAGLSWDDNCVACSKDIFIAAQELNMVLEINGYGLRKQELKTPDGYRRPYPLSQFWELAQEYDIKVICNSDAHQPQDIAANIDEALMIAEENNLVLADTDLMFGMITVVKDRGPQPFWLEE